jgi:phage-related protein
LGVAVVAWGVVTAAAAWSAVVPFLPVIAVLLAVAAAAYLIYEAWTNNWGGIQEKTQAVFQFITDAVNAFIAFFGPAIQAALEVVRFYWEYWSAQIKAIIELFSLAMQGRWYEFGQKLREIFDNFLNAIKTVWTAAWDFIKNIPTTVMDIFKNTDWLAVGTGIIQGIANGITSGVGFIVDAAVAAAEAALEAAMGFLGINSPSTVFEKQVGMQMAAGVAKGWENGVKDLVSPSMANIDPAKVNIRPIGLQNANPQGSAPAVRQQSQNASHTIIINNPVPEKSDASVRRALRHVSYTGVA